MSYTLQKIKEASKRMRKGVSLWHRNSFRKAVFKTRTLYVILLVSFRDGAKASAAIAKAMSHFFIHKTNTLQ
jgi:ribosomal protein S20